MDKHDLLSHSFTGRYLTSPLLLRRSPLIQYLRNLRLQASLRHEEQKVAVFGRKILEEWLARSGDFESIYRSPECPPLTQHDKLASSDSLEWASGLKQIPHEACAAILKKPAAGRFESMNFALILDGVQDPGNVGTLIRSAGAFGIDGVILLPGSCDPFNDKAMRSSMGASLYIPVQTLQHNELMNHLQRCKTHVWLADMCEGSKPAEESCLLKERPTWIVLGSEAHGLNPIWQGQGHLIHLPMHPQVESLNVAVAGSILMYLASSQRATS